MDAPFGPLRAACLACSLALAACSDDSASADAPPAPGEHAPRSDLPYAREVVRFTPGDAAGFGADSLPDVVLGPPRGQGRAAGSLDVLSLGAGGEIVLGFGELAIADGPGPDLVVFENAFYPDGNPASVFAEPGEVALSEDGESFVEFACDPEPDARGRFSGCAGNTPTEEYDVDTMTPLDPAETGGDAFDLAELGLARARYVRIRDRSQTGSGNNAGFDLDAVGLVHPE